MVRRKRAQVIGGISGGLMVLVAGCGAATDAVVVMAPRSAQVPVAGQPPASRSAATQRGAVAPPVTAPATTVPPTTTPVPVTTTTIPAAQAPVPVPAIAALAPARVGQKGPAVLALEQRLVQLGFWLDAADGTYNAVTAQAVMAYQKDQGLKRTGTADAPTVERMSQAQNRAMSHAVVGDLIEIDKAKQLLYVVRNGAVVWAVNTSTGSGGSYRATSKLTGKDVSSTAVTPNGMHRVYRQDGNGWHEGDLGAIYRPKYFSGGAAIHGFRRIPGYPASHGCVRVTTSFMDFVWTNNLAPMKSTIWVHDGSANARQPLLVGSTPG